MPKPWYGDESPIAALATPPGESALALIRCSGPGSLALLSAVFSRPRKLREAPGNSIVHGWIRFPQGGDRIDEVLVAVYRAPKSYTGEEGADISCHGGFAVAGAVLGALKAAGFREGLPGEFSFRAFMNGKLDLTRSESVMELVRARTDSGRQRALDRLAGKLRGEIAALKGRLVEALAETELYLDYDEEELGIPGGGSGLPGRALVEEALGGLERLAAGWPGERLYQEGALAVIAGRPNAGKSSLFNALLGEDRSIVTGEPGSTRDWIEALVNIRGIPLRLADTAGLREAEGPDRAEELGIRRSRELLERADLVLYLVDGALGPREEDRAFLKNRGALPSPLIPVWNKADLARPPENAADRDAAGPDYLPVSAKTGEGLAELQGAMAGALGAGGPGETGDTGLGSGRQKELVDRARGALGEALDLADRGGTPDLAAPLLREAVDALGEITGEVSTADILEAIFSKFCVGK
jgi:tRNA modification GTPase